jgi:hypothetical protein
MIPFSRIVVLATLSFAGVVQAAEFDDGARTKLIEEYAQKLQYHYVFPDKGKLLADSLRSHLKHGDYAGLEEKALAEQVQKDLDAVVPDQHNGMVYVEFDALEEPSSPPPKPAVPVARPGPDNFGLAKFEMKGKVAYLQVSRFGPVDSFATEALAKVMSQAADSQAMIVDLRDGQGGMPPMVTLLSSYFFDDRPVHLLDELDRSGKVTDSFITTTKLTGPRYGSQRPLYILVDEETASAAEAFAYGLQKQKRAVIVGHKTSGGAHKQFGEPVSHHLIAFVAIGRSVDPITQSNWERTGVQPDIEVSAAQALDVALAQIAKAPGAQ